MFHWLLLYLPVLCDCIPHSDLPCVAGGHQLVPDEEEIVHRNAEAEHAWVGGGQRSGGHLVKTSEVFVLFLRL